jgi:predicted Zn-dependent protease
LSDAALEEVLAALAARGDDAAEVYAKAGRSRRVTVGVSGEAAVQTQEEGWAVRAGGRSGGFFFAATGRPEPQPQWPEATGAPPRLPEAAATAEIAPGDPEAPLLAESEGRALLEAVGEGLGAELAGARLLGATLTEGTSDSELRSSRGVDVRWRSRAATLRVEATAPGAARAVAVLELAERQARDFRPQAVARRLADLLVVAAGDPPPERDRGEFVLAPALGSRLLCGLLPLFVGAAAAARLARLRDRRGRVGGDLLTLVDDGRLAGGALAAPVDGEGVPTREVVLVEEGVLRQPLLAWHEARPPQTRASGCSRRASWRDLPRPGPTHFYWRPQSGVAAATLLDGVARGYYLLEARGAGRFDLAAGEMAVPVCGFAVRAGRAAGPIAHAWLCGTIGAFLRGVTGVARDLAFLPLDGMIGAPTLLATGLELRRSPA